MRPLRNIFYKLSRTEQRREGVAAYLWSPHCKEPMPKIQNQIFPEKKLRGHSPNFHIHVPVSDLYIPAIHLPILLQEICGPILGIYKSLTGTGMWELGLRPRNSQKRNHT